MQNIPESEKTAPAMQAPLATIIIVNHNYGEFVGRCIRSVDEQDYRNIQCIVLDCASTDDSLSAIEEAIGRATKSVFQVIRRNVNQGHLVNCLSALDQAKGTFLNYLDADDFLFPEFVSTHIKAHLNDLNSAALSVTDQIQVNETGQVLAGTCHWHQKVARFRTGNGLEGLDARPDHGAQTAASDGGNGRLRAPLHSGVVEQLVDGALDLERHKRNCVSQKRHRKPRTAAGAIQGPSP